MPEPKTIPQDFSKLPVRAPSEAHDAWLARTDRLVAEFERTPKANAAEPPISIGFVLMLCDHLWDEHGEEADFAALDVPRLVRHCEPVLQVAAMAQCFTDTLVMFFEFLDAQHELDTVAASSIMAQLTAVPEYLARPS